MENNSDEYYIDQIIAGEPQYYAVLVEKYKNMAFSLSIKLLGNREEAEEAAQDAFIKAYSALAKFNRTASFKTWFFRVVYNNAISQLRKKKKIEISIDDIKISNNEITETETALTYLEATDRSRFLDCAMQQLLPDEKALLEMYYYDDLSVDQIAEITTLSLSNVKIKLFRTRKKLYSKLSNIMKKELISIL